MGFWTKLLGLEPQKLPVHIDDDNFEREILGSNMPVVLDAWGPGCMPCKHLEPIIISLNERYGDKVKIAELNVAAASRLRVRGTPTVIYFRGRREVERVVGLRGELYHRQIIEEDLLDDPTEDAAS
jgi:thioredoxin 1